MSISVRIRPPLRALSYRVALAVLIVLGAAAPGATLGQTGDRALRVADEPGQSLRIAGAAGRGQADFSIVWVIAVGLLNVLTVTVALAGHRNRLRAARLARDLSDNLHVADALEHLDVMVTIYDADLRPVHWNPATERYAPDQVALLRQRGSFHELLAHSRLTGPFLPRMDAEMADEFARQILERVMSGEAVRRVLKTTDGRTIETYDGRVSDGVYASVRTNVTLSAQQADLIEAQRRELEEVNKDLAAFVHVAAHDLRAPLRHSRLAVECLGDDLAERYGDLPQDLRELLGIIGTSAGRMTSLVEDLLDYAFAGQAGPGPEPFDAAGVIANVVALSAVPDGTTVTHTLDVPPLRVDRTAFEIVLRNLVSNAVKHHDRDLADIVIRGEHVDGFAIFEVEDDGPGIPQAHRESIFEPFAKLRSRDDVEGSGLGLSFVRKTVDAWGGSVSVSCPGERGSIFRFTVPLGARVAGTAPIAA